MPELGVFFRVAFHAPLVRQQRGGATRSGLHLVTYSGAWLRSRWRDHDVNPREETSVFLWLVEQGRESAEPPTNVPPSAWALCRVLA